ncbi:TPA: hypothetical protein JBJ29_15210 [Legionella pneumophila]|nr:hypothetical protein [Legionella pneumophila]
MTMFEIGLKDITVSSDFDLYEVESVLRKYGAAVLPRWLNTESIKKLFEDWYAIREYRNKDELECVQRAGGNVADYAALYRNKSGQEQFKSVNQIFSHPKIIQIVDRVIGKPNLLNEEIYLTLDIGKDEEIAPSHFDKTWNLKFMIYLEDILESGYGAFAVHPGSQLIARKKFRSWFEINSVNGFVEIGTASYYEMPNEYIPEDLTNCVEILAPAGTLIIFNTDVFHRGSYLKKGAERKVIRGHACPGYKAPGMGDKIRKNSRQWVRGEHWELYGKVYSRFSKDGFLEWREYNKMIKEMA